MAALSLEEITHFGELLLGRYLNNHNNERKPWGTTWEREQKSRQALMKLEAQVGEDNRLKQAVGRVATFSDLLDLLPTTGSLTVPPSKFVSLYLALPKSERDSLISARELLDLYYNSSWVRSSVKLDEGVAKALLIDRQNQIIRTISLDERYARVSSDRGRTARGSLSDDPAYTGHIYLSEQFLEVFFKLSEEERGSLIPDPGMLLAVPKPITFIGLAPAGREPFSLISFESLGPNGVILTTYPISPDAYDRLVFLMAMRESDTLFREEPPPAEPGESKPVRRRAL
jgi:hypothetical protein